MTLTGSRRRQWLGWALGTASLPLQSRPTLQWRERALLGFGTTLWLRAGHADGGRVDVALDEAVARLRHIERQMSLFDPSSALVRLNREGVLRDPDPDLLAVLRHARTIAQRSGGAFDPTIQPLWALWQRAAASGRRPTSAEMAQARARVGWRALRITAREIGFERTGMALSLNGIAQGHAADAVRAILRRHGVADALLDTGEWSPLGHSPTGAPWRLGVADPRLRERVVATVLADGRAVAASSDAELAFSADRRDHHIIDPRSGRSPPHLAAVVVAAPSATYADALTKVLFMADAAGALALARRFGADAIVVDKAGAVSASAGWRRA